MTENTKRIRNPLTIIGIFCALAEVGGTVVLPFVLKENQVYYMWFLMVFPILLVVSFFLTLNFNSRVLYAPSDFRDDSNFLQYLQRTVPGSSIQRTNADFEESKKTIPEGDRLILNEQPAPPAAKSRPMRARKSANVSARVIASTPVVTSVPQVSRERYFFIEELLFSKVKAELKADLSRDYALMIGNQTYQFDAVAYNPNGATIIEFKVLLSNLLNKRSLQDTLSRMQAAGDALAVLGVSVQAILAYALHLGETKSDILRDRIQNIIGNYHFRPTLRLYDIDALESEYGLTSK
jgi:hypothetical protein